MNFKNILNSQTPFWLLAFSLLIGLTLPTLIQDGMFMDAMLYTSVSHNLSQGIGTFWFPQFSAHNIAGLSSFHEQPPLAFGIQSLFYKLLGDSMYVERFYTFLTICLTALLIIFSWREIYREKDGLRKLGWLPVIFWITIPVCFWSYSNNMHENTMGVFTLISVLFAYKAFHSNRFEIILLCLSAISIFLASFTKGLPGFFPIGAPLIYWITTRKINFSKAFYQTLIISLLPLTAYIVLFNIPESKESLSNYFFKRALHRINEVPTVDTRFYILGRLFMELLPQFFLVAIFLIIAQKKKIKLTIPENLKDSVFFIALGLSASAPLMLTMVQKGFYFVPSLPFFAIGLSIIIAPVIFKLTELIQIKSKTFKTLLFFCSFLFMGAITFSLSKKGSYSRNKELLQDVYTIGEIVPRLTTVSIPAEIWNQWDLQCYLVRYYNISLEQNYQNKYCIMPKSMQDQIPKQYDKVNIKTFEYDLYKRR